MPDVALEDLPRFIAPMLARAGSAPTHAGWALEVKWDGMRAQLRYDGQRVCVRSRPGRDCTTEFPELTAIANALAGRHAPTANRPQGAGGTAARAAQAAPPTG